MGTRADFYIGTDQNAEWLGSIAWDGYPDGIEPRLLRAKNKRQFKAALKKFFSERDDVTLPEMGWPWPWDDSRTTDFAYAWDGKRTVVSCFGRGYISVRSYLRMSPDKQEAFYDKAKEQVFPNMKDRKRVTLGSRSGLIVVSA